MKIGEVLEAIKEQQAEIRELKLEMQSLRDQKKVTPMVTPR